MCIFCKIINGEISSEKLFENENFIVIRDIEPKAKCHFLAISKNHFKFLSEMQDDDKSQLADMFATIPILVKKFGLENGYRIVINQGDDAGQSVGHLHLHILGGQKMDWNPG